MNVYFAMTKLKPIDPVFTGFFMVWFGLCLLALVVWLLWHFSPLFIAKSRKKREIKAKAANDIWFDLKESMLHCGHFGHYIDRRSYEYYVCSIVLAKPYEYHEDTDISYARDAEDDGLGRSVEQAVRRLNKRGMDKLGLKNNLFKRDKQSTAVNDVYRKHILTND